MSAGPLDLHLRADLSVLAPTRHQVVAMLRGADHHWPIADVELVAAELLSNAIRESTDDDVRFRLAEVEGPSLLLVVSNAVPVGHTAPTVSERVPTTARRGRGLAIVAALATEFELHAVAHRLEARARFAPIA